MALTKLKEQSQEMIQINENVKRYREQVELLENEIKQLEQEVAKALDFEKDMKLQDKKDMLPNFKERLRKAEQQAENDLRLRGQKIAIVAYRYSKVELEEDEQVEEAYQTAKTDLIKAYESIEAYELAREKKAEQLEKTIEATGYFEAVKKANVVTGNDAIAILNANKTRLNLREQGGNFISTEQFFDNLLDK